MSDAVKPSSRKNTIIWDNELLKKLCDAARQYGLREYWPEYMKRVIRELADALNIELPRR